MFANIDGLPSNNVVDVNIEMLQTPNKLMV